MGRDLLHELADLLMYRLFGSADIRSCNPASTEEEAR
jgi:hypothetical protein